MIQHKSVWTLYLEYSLLSWASPAIYMGGQNLQNHAQSDMIFRLISFYINGNLIKYCWLLFLHVLYLIASL